MERRKFLKIGMAASVASAAGLVIPAPVLAMTSKSPLQSALAGSVFYTAEAPGRWSGKEGGHVPTFELSGGRVEVTTGHGMDGYTHYIVKHVLLDENLGFIAETMFNPETDAPISDYDVSGLNTRLFALSICNKHDAWLNVLEL